VAETSRRDVRTVQRAVPTTTDHFSRITEIKLSLPFTDSMAALSSSNSAVNGVNYE
jgi:hypothetical protein